MDAVRELETSVLFSLLLLVYFVVVVSLFPCSFMLRSLSKQALITVVTPLRARPNYVT